MEALTDRMEDEANAYFQRIEALGGVIPALEVGFMQREIAEAAFRFQQEVDRGERTIVGVNDFVADEAVEIPILEMDPAGLRAPGGAAAACARRAAITAR